MEARLSVYNRLLRKIKSPQETVEFLKSGKLNVCLIEYRNMIEIEYVLNALLCVYPSSEIGLSIVCGNQNICYVSNVVKKWKNVRIINTGHDNLNRCAYSQMLKSPTFWEYFMQWSHVLIYQTDALIMRKIDDVYFSYDYVGAPWRNINNWIGPSKPKYNGGNGGFSLRRVSSMIRVCEQFRWTSRDDIRASNEDGFFCNQELLFPPEDIHNSFSVEEVFASTPIGCHQVYRYLPDDKYYQLISYIKHQLIDKQQPVVTNKQIGETNGVLIFDLFGGMNGVGFFNQLFSLELAIYMSNFFKRALHVRITQPLAAKGVCSWDYGTIFDYILQIDDFLPYGFMIFDNEKHPDTDDVHRIVISQHMSSCYYVDKELRVPQNIQDIEEFSNGRTDISEHLDVLFDKNLSTIHFKGSNASRFFYNFYTTRINYSLMNKIAIHLSRYPSNINNIFESINLPTKYIAIHMRLGDVYRVKSIDHEETKLIQSNFDRWMLVNNMNDYPICLMCDNETHPIVERLKEKYTIILTSELYDKKVLNDTYRDQSIAEFLLEKKICENANIFIGTRTSTVSVHINYVNYINYRPYQHYLNYKNVNFDSDRLCYKVTASDKKWSWSSYEYDRGHPISWTLFFDDNVYR